MSWFTIHRYGPCIGITLFRFRRRQVELWWAPTDYATPEHSHENSDGEFLILWARNRRIWRKTHTLCTNGKVFKINQHKRYFDAVGRGDEYIANVPPWRFKTLSVRAGIKHGFDKGSSPMIWLCFEKWKKGVPITSVADDFKTA